MDKPEVFISLKSWGDFLEFTANEFDCSNLGLLIAKHRPAPGFGVLAQLLKASTNIGSALVSGHRHVGIYTDIRWDLRINDEQATVVRVDRSQPKDEMRQYKSLSIAQYVKLLRGLLGPKWHPGSVYFMFRSPKITRPYKQLFRVNLIGTQGAIRQYFRQHIGNQQHTFLFGKLGIDGGVGESPETRPLQRQARHCNQDDHGPRGLCLANDAAHKRLSLCGWSLPQEIIAAQFHNNKIGLISSQQRTGSRARLARGITRYACVH